MWFGHQTITKYAATTESPKIYLPVKSNRIFHVPRFIFYINASKSVGYCYFNCSTAIMISALTSCELSQTLSQCKFVSHYSWSIETPSTLNAAYFLSRTLSRSRSLSLSLCNDSGFIFTERDRHLSDIHVITKTCVHLVTLISINTCGLTIVFR